jgi:predicted phage tail protein
MMVALAALVASIEAALPQVACTAGQKAAVTVELLFGRKIGDRIAVSQAAFARFVDREITPRFPGGLTIIDAQGQWRDRKRNIVVHEPSKLVQIVMPGTPEDQAKIDAIVAAYKRRFKQQAVGVVKRAACVSF